MILWDFALNRRHKWQVDESSCFTQWRESEFRCFSVTYARLWKRHNVIVHDLINLNMKLNDMCFTSDDFNGAIIALGYWTGQKVDHEGTTRILTLYRNPNHCDCHRQLRIFFTLRDACILRAGQYADRNRYFAPYLIWLLDFWQYRI